MVSVTETKWSGGEGSSDRDERKGEVQQFYVEIQGVEQAGGEGEEGEVVDDDEREGEEGGAGEVGWVDVLQFGGGEMAC